MRLNVVVMYLEHLDEQYVELNLQQLLFCQHPINQQKQFIDFEKKENYYWFSN